MTLSLYYHDPRCFYRTLFSAFSLHGFECVKPLKTKIVFHSVVLTISQTYLHYIISTDIFISIQRLAKTLWKSTPKCSHLIFVKKKTKQKIPMKNLCLQPRISFFLTELIWALYCYKIHLSNVHCAYNHICIPLKFNLL